MITIVTAMESEAGPLRRMVGRALWRGQVSVLVGGVGNARPKIKFDPSSEMALSMGFGGAACTEASVGHLVLSENLYAVGEDRVIRTDSQLIRIAEETCLEAGLAYNVADSVTVPNFVNDPGEKATLGTSYGAWSINMEDYWLAKAADAAKLPFLAVRAVVDRADQVVHPSIASLALKDQGLFTQAVRALGAVMRRPWLFPNLITMARQARLAQESLCAFTEHFVPRAISLNNRETADLLIGEV